MPDSTADNRSSAQKTFTAYARGAGGGLLVGMPVFMTMEVWWGGFTVSPVKLLLLVIFNYGVLLVLQHYSGLHPRKTRGGQMRAALVAYGLGLATASLALVALGVINTGTALRDFVGKIILLAVAVSVGASVAMSEFVEDAHLGEPQIAAVGIASQDADAVGVKAIELAHCRDLRLGDRVSHVDGCGRCAHRSCIRRSCAHGSSHQCSRSGVTRALGRDPAYQAKRST